MGVSDNLIQFPWNLSLQSHRCICSMITAGSDGDTSKSFVLTDLSMKSYTFIRPRVPKKLPPKPPTPPPPPPPPPPAVKVSMSG